LKRKARPSHGNAQKKKNPPNIHPGDIQVVTSNNPIFVDPERGIESTLGVFHLSTGYYLWIGSFLTLLLGEIALFVLKNKIG